MTSEMSVALSRFRFDSETTMKSIFDRSLPRAGLVLLFSSGVILLLTAAERKVGRVTQVVRDVRLLAPQVAARPAHLNEVVTDGSAVHTGADSRAELTFADLTITRVGANSIFSFEQNGRNVNIESGAILSGAKGFSRRAYSQQCSPSAQRERRRCLSRYRAITTSSSFSKEAVRPG